MRLYLIVLLIFNVLHTPLIIPWDLYGSLMTNLIFSAVYAGIITALLHSKKINTLKSESVKKHE